MSEVMEPSTKFTPLQHIFLGLFGRNTPEEDLLAIKDIIDKYFQQKLQKKADELVEQTAATGEGRFKAKRP